MCKVVILKSVVVTAMASAVIGCANRSQPPANSDYESAEQRYNRSESEMTDVSRSADDPVNNSISVETENNTPVNELLGNRSTADIDNESPSRRAALTDLDSGQQNPVASRVSAEAYTALMERLESRLDGIERVLMMINEKMANSNGRGDDFETAETAAVLESNNSPNLDVTVDENQPLERLVPPRRNQADAAIRYMRSDLDRHLRQYERRRQAFRRSLASYKLDSKFHVLKAAELLFTRTPQTFNPLPARDVAAFEDFVSAAEALQPILEEWIENGASPGDADYEELRKLQDEIDQVLVMESPTTGNRLLDFLFLFTEGEPAFP